MKKILLTLAILILPGIAFAATRPVSFGRSMPGPRNFSSEAVYYTSSTCADGINIQISAKASFLYAINVTTVSGPGGLVAAFDSKTSAGGLPLTSSAATTSLMPWIWNVGASSGIFVNNIGGACIGVVYSEQQ